MIKLNAKIKTPEILLVFLSVVLVIVIATGGTIAYFSGQDEVKNTLTIGKISVALDEPKWNPEDGLDIRPGKVADKDPTVTAVEGDSYMRVKMEIVDGDGNLLTDASRIGLVLQTIWYEKQAGSISNDGKYTTDNLNTLVTSGKISAEYNNTDFRFAGIETGKPAVRYYNYISNSGIFQKGTVIQLFNKIVIPTSWHNTEIFVLDGDEFVSTPDGKVEVTAKGTGYKIVLTGEAIQSAEMENADSAFSALDDATGVTRDTSGI